jgi:lipoyl(octanoyl) transferase
MMTTRYSVLVSAPNRPEQSGDEAVIPSAASISRQAENPTRPCSARWLGRVPYADGLGLQAELVRQRAAGEIPDQLLLLEHPHVVTLGRTGKDAHVLADGALLQALGVDFFETGRGGDVTYHGPGQLVAYPILDLAPDRCDLHRYVRDLERVMLAVLDDYGVHGHTLPGKTGVWVERAAWPAAKVGAIGVRVARWITSHGIALNVTTDLRYFDLIVPCGIAGSAVTSLAELCAAGSAPAGGAGLPARDDAPLTSPHGAPPAAPPPTITVEAVAHRFVLRFGEVFEREMTLESRAAEQ